MKQNILGLIHPFMFGLFPIFFVYANNLTEISLGTLGMPALIIFGVTIVLIFIFTKITKNIQKSTLTISFLLLLFFTIGYVRMWLHGFEIFGFAAERLEFVLFLYSIVFFGGMYIIYKIKDVSKPTQIISIMSIAVVLSFVPSIILDTSVFDYINTNKFYEEIKFNSDTRPDIYYILLDGYASADSLKRDYKFDNSEFLEFLTDSGFIVAEGSFSNYGGTSLAMPSALNMNYLHNHPNYSLDDIILSKYLFSTNLVMRTLQDNGYTTVYIDGGSAFRDMYVSDKILCHSTENGLMQALIDTSMVSYIHQGFFWDSWDKIRSCGFSELENVHESTKSPFFVYTHIRSPHEPYTFGPNGEYIEDAERIEELSEEENNKLYVYQLQWTNKKMTEIIPKLISSSEQKPIIIISSDHGWNQFPDSPPTDADFIQMHSNFEAFYLPNDINTESYKKITPVNIFRNAFNDYFETDLEILEEKAYHIEMDRVSGKFLKQIDITNIIRPSD